MYEQNAYLFFPFFLSLSFRLLVSFRQFFVGPPFGVSSLILLKMKTRSGPIHIILSLLLRTWAFTCPVDVTEWEFSEMKFKKTSGIFVFQIHVLWIKKLISLMMLTCFFILGFGFDFLNWGLFSSWVAGVSSSISICIAWFWRNKNALHSHCLKTFVTIFARSQSY